MQEHKEKYDAVIIGAGPSGLACAIEFQKHGLSYLVIEKGCLAHSIFRFPTDLTFFSTPDLLEIGDVPFIIPAEKPKRIDVLNYYRRVTEFFNLNIHFSERVTAVVGRKPEIQITTEQADYVARHLVLATGQYDNPNIMRIPGENLPKVSHYFSEGHPYYKRKVAVIGGKNSAVEAALDLYKHGAEVTLIHRGETFGPSVKYWIRPDIENRIKEGKIKSLFNTRVTEIKEKTILVEGADGRINQFDNDFVFAMTGYNIDTDFLAKAGVELQPDTVPCHHPDTLESNVPGVYVAGVLTAGSNGSKVFIENSRNHGTKIIGHILNGSK
ncbi:MAG: YpdA family putative bacillithiol disulfide reductase [bacterium]